MSYIEFILLNQLVHFVIRLLIPIRALSDHQVELKMAQIFVNPTMSHDSFRFYDIFIWEGLLGGPRLPGGLMINLLSRGETYHYI